MSKIYLKPMEYVVDLSYNKNISDLNIPVSPGEEDNEDSDKVREEVNFDEIPGHRNIWEKGW